ncbi:acyl transferase [Chitinophagales bacterium]|nr:acyl transferase [Chitinophagales bacterium]
MASIDIFKADDDFEAKALEIFRFQATENEVYGNYIKHLGLQFDQLTRIEEIPFLPIELFKTQRVFCQNLSISKVFKSSGTGGDRSHHYIVDPAIYETSFLLNFEAEFGALEELCVLALLPNYQKNPNSSLLYMINEIVERTKTNGSKFLDVNDAKLAEKLKNANGSKLKTILVGTSFALLDFAEQYPLDLSNLIVMETGGMKGRRVEITRFELHDSLKSKLNQQDIYSEYGMCELLSQAYAKKNGVFSCPPWMRVYTRPIGEPFSDMQVNKSGILKVIDLANIYSCSFIETADLGIVSDDGSFEVIGRIDHAQIRGCALLTF